MGNWNMTGEFPAALASIPQLADLMIHDTNLTSTVPLPSAWPAIQDLIVSGTGGLCGPIPSVCSNEKVYCDVHTNFLPCEEAASELTEGPTPSALLRSQTRPTDVAALMALWEANGRQSTLIGWGEGDPILWRRTRRAGQCSRFRPVEGGRMRAMSRTRGLQVSLRVSDLAASEELEWHYSRNFSRADGAEVALSQREQHDGSFAGG